MTKKRDGQFHVLKRIRYGILLLLLVYIGLIFSSKGDSSTPFDTVEKAVKKAASDKELKKADARELKRLYGLNEKELEDVSLYYTQATMGVNELLLVRVKEESEIGEVEDAVKTRRDTQIDNFDGYGAEQVKLLQESVIKARGRYLLFVVSPKAEHVEKAFRKSL